MRERERERERELVKVLMNMCEVVHSESLHVIKIYEVGKESQIIGSTEGLWEAAVQTDLCTHNTHRLTHTHTHTHTHTDTHIHTDTHTHTHTHTLTHNNVRREKLPLG